MNMHIFYEYIWKMVYFCAPPHPYRWLCILFFYLVF